MCPSPASDLSRCTRLAATLQGRSHPLKTEKGTKKNGLRLHQPSGNNVDIVLLTTAEKMSRTASATVQKKQQVFTGAWPPAQHGRVFSPRKEFQKHPKRRARPVTQSYSVLDYPSKVLIDKRNETCLGATSWTRETELDLEGYIACTGAGRGSRTIIIGSVRGSRDLDHCSSAGGF